MELKPSACRSNALAPADHHGANGDHAQGAGSRAPRLRMAPGLRGAGPSIQFVRATDGAFVGGWMKRRLADRSNVLCGPRAAVRPTLHHRPLFAECGHSVNNV
jgi:hypothetical protein